MTGKRGEPLKKLEASTTGSSVVGSTLFTMGKSRIDRFWPCKVYR